MKKSIDKPSIGKGAAFLYIESIAGIISGFIFWIIISKIATTNTIGISSSVISFAGIMSVLSGFGIQYSIQRFLGKFFSEKNLPNAKLFVKSSLIIVSLFIILFSIIILFFKNWIYINFGIDFNLLIISLTLIGSATITMLFRSIVISSLQTKMLPVITIISAITKVILSIILVIIGSGALGLTLGYTSSQVLFLILLGIVILTILKSDNKNDKTDLNIIWATKTLMVAGTAFWIPLFITTIGSQLGPLVVFKSEGSGPAAIYFMSLTIVNGITSAIYALFTIALPAMSSMKDGRKRFAWQITRLSAIITLPFSTSIIFYSKEILQLLGPNYAQGSLALEILLLSIFPTIIMTGINDYVHSIGKYRQVLIIGLATSIPRTMFYFILVPIFSSSGASVAYTLGSVAGLIISAIISRKTGLQIFWKDLSYMLIIPLTISLILNLLGFNFFIGIIITLAISYLLFTNIHILTKSDIKLILEILPRNISYPVNRIINKFYNRLKS